jgi:acetolactate synthase-1/2/3 large subunit
VVTAGPGVTNTLTAVKNAQMAQSPIIVIGGAAATALRGRGALQDIDQLSLFRSVVKWSTGVRRVKDIVPALEQAFRTAQEGVPGPVFVEIPIDLLYEEKLVRQLYNVQSGGRSLSGRLVNRYLEFHVNRLFAGSENIQVSGVIQPTLAPIPPQELRRVREKLRRAERPLLLVGSQATLAVNRRQEVADAVSRLSIPTFLSGMARGLLGKEHPLQMRHKRREALRETDLVILAGVPCDFRLDYGRQIRRSACYISVNRSRHDLTMNRRPNIGILGDPGLFLRSLAENIDIHPDWTGWQHALRQRDEERGREINQLALAATERVNPLHLFHELGRALPDNAILIADGGDFVATGSYILSPAAPLTWLDPGPFGTLGVGAGFALGAKLARPEAEVWIIYGDGAAGFSLIEFDTFVRHGLPVIAVVGNDAGWTQIAREQVPTLGDDVGTVLARTEYDRAAIGLGAAGYRLDDPELIEDVISQAREAHASGKPVLINVLISQTNFRQGSISM